MTLTKEQLIAAAVGRIEMAEETLSNDLVPLARHTFEIDLELARIALASLEAEPVAWLLSGGGAKNNVSFDSGNAYADPLREVTPLYTAPPAPVSVPDEIQKLKDGRGFRYVKDGVHYSVNYANGWNQCRAAMLQGAKPVSQPCTLRDGWVAVPVEPTPKMREAYHQAQAEHEDADGLWSPDHQWQAMLAAAPQQEVKP